MLDVPFSKKTCFHCNKFTIINHFDYLNISLSANPIILPLLMDFKPSLTLSTTKHQIQNKYYNHVKTTLIPCLCLCLQLNPIIPAASQSGVMSPDSQNHISSSAPSPYQTDHQVGGLSPYSPEVRLYEVFCWIFYPPLKLCRGWKHCIINLHGAD